MGMGGGGGGQSSQQNQYSNISPAFQPYVGSVLGAAQQQVFNQDQSGNITGINPYTAYGQITGTDANGNPIQSGINQSANAAANASVAGFTGLQNQAFQGAQNLSNSAAPNITGAAAYGSLGAGQDLGNQLTSTSAMQQYMNPYIQNALQPALALQNQQYGQALAQEQGNATRSGAFGGSREALMAGQNQQNQMLANNQLIGNAYSQAFGNAQQQAQNVAQLGLQGYNQAGSLAGQQLNQQQGILGLQNQYGTQQQQQQQNLINQAMQNYATARQYPMQQLQQLSAIAQPYVTKDVTTTQQAAAPTPFANLVGLAGTGASAYGLLNSGNSSPTIINNPAPSPVPAINQAKGGVTKSYKKGGLVELSLYQALGGK
jgi:hypothetical protein